MRWKESEACIEGHLVCGALFCLADPRPVVLDFEPRLSVQTTRWREWVILTKLLACAHLSMGPLVRLFPFGCEFDDLLKWIVMRGIWLLTGSVLENDYVLLSDFLREGGCGSYMMNHG